MVLFVSVEMLNLSDDWRSGYVNDDYRALAEGMSCSIIWPKTSILHVEVCLEFPLHFIVLNGNQKNPIRSIESSNHKFTEKLWLFSCGSVLPKVRDVQVIKLLLA